MIVFKTPQAQETFPATAMDFDGYTNTLQNEVYNEHMSYYVASVPSNIITFVPVNVKRVSTSDDLNINVMKSQGEPYILKELRKQNDYSQFKVYKNMVWERSLRRDYKNIKNINENINLYGQEYINQANGV